MSTYRVFRCAPRRRCAWRDAAPLPCCDDGWLSSEARYYPTPVVCPSSGSGPRTTQWTHLESTRQSCFVLTARNEPVGDFAEVGRSACRQCGDRGLTTRLGRRCWSLTVLPQSSNAQDFPAVSDSKTLRRVGWRVGQIHQRHAVAACGIPDAASPGEGRAGGHGQRQSSLRSVAPRGHCAVTGETGACVWLTSTSRWV